MRIRFLNARTNAVLVLNSLAAVAVASSMAEGHIRLIVAIIMIVINGLWMFHAKEANRFIGDLTQQMKKSKDTAPLDEVFRWDRVHKIGRHYGPTRFMAVVIPWLLFLSWIVGVGVPLYGLLFPPQ